MKDLIIAKLHSCGFIIKPNGNIFKDSATNKSKEKAGQLNDRSVYFYAQNVAPFNTGTNTFKEILGSEYVYSPSVPQISAKADTDAEHNFTFEDYIRTTKKKNQFGLFLKTQAENLSNLYDLRGVKNGYLEDATLLPYIDYNNNFVTAKIVKYNSITGKRSKAQYSNNWFHAYKPIKSELGITDKISKKVNCFFGENLAANNNKPVVIVEAEKTAIILSMIFEDIVFIAAGGLGKLKTLDYKFLLNRDVSLYPDNGASEWFEIGKKRNWYVSTILENKGSKGSDAADYLESDLWLEIEAELNSIGEGMNHAKRDHPSDDYTANLNFSYKEKQVDRFCSTVTKELGLNYYIEMADSERGSLGSFTGKYFKITNKEFYCITANVNVNKYGFEDGKKVKPTAKTLLKRLEQTFRILKKLNPEENIPHHFKKVLNHVLENGNYLFNTSYILNELVTLWDNDDNNVKEYVKKRDWVKLSGSIKDEDFIRFLNDDRKAADTNYLLMQLQPMLNEGAYIIPQSLGIHKAQFNPFVWGLIKEYNEDVLGCSRINIYNEKIKINEYLMFVQDHTSKLENNKKIQNYHSICNRTYIDRDNNVLGFEKLSQETVYSNTLVDRRIISSFFSFKPKRNSLRNIKAIVEYYLSNPNDLEMVRSAGRIQPKNNIPIGKIIKALKDEHNKRNAEFLSCKEAFDYPIDYTGSRLNIPQEEAMQENAQFLYSWILFNYPDISEVEKIEIRKKPINYLLQVNTIIAA